MSPLLKFAALLLVQGHAHGLHQFTQLHGYRGLGQVQHFRGPGHGARLMHRQQNFQLPESAHAGMQPTHK